MAKRSHSYELTKQLFRADKTDPRHGTNNGYTNLGCRCTRCSRANSDRQAEYRDRLAMTPWDLIPHGTENGYNNYSCSCDDCRNAHRIAHKEWRHRRDNP